MEHLYLHQFRAMNPIIQRLEAIAGGDPWKMRDSLRIFIDELKEKREAAILAREAESKASGEVPTLASDNDAASPPSGEEMIEDAQKAVKEFFPETV
jgi:hypothetical protein